MEVVWDREDRRKWGLRIYGKIRLIIMVRELWEEFGFCFEWDEVFIMGKFWLEKWYDIFYF